MVVPDPGKEQSKAYWSNDKQNCSIHHVEGWTHFLLIKICFILIMVRLG